MNPIAHPRCHQCETVLHAEQGHAWTWWRGGICCIECVLADPTAAGRHQRPRMVALLVLGAAVIVLGLVLTTRAQIVPSPSLRRPSPLGERITTSDGATVTGRRYGDETRYSNGVVTEPGPLGTRVTNPRTGNEPRDSYYTRPGPVGERQPDGSHCRPGPIGVRCR